MESLGDLETAEAELLLEELLLRAERARESLPEFFSMVLREENTQQPIECAPHQQLMLEFIEAHDRCVIKCPVGHAKTYTTAGYVLHLLGRNPSARGAVVSAARYQAEKVVKMVRAYIEQSPELKMVFPHLRQGTGTEDLWSAHAITVQRPFGIRDPSLTAVGMESNIQGARLSWILVDDILNMENTATPEYRRKVYAWIKMMVETRLDPRGAKMVVTNTVYHPEDLLHELERQGWPTLTMRVDGTIVFSNCDGVMSRSGKWVTPPFDTELVRPAEPGSSECRLVAHDPDPDNQQTLMPVRMNREEMIQKRDEMLPEFFNPPYMQIARNDATALCKQVYVDICTRLARDLEHFHFQSSYQGPCPTFTGLDLAVSQKDKADETAFFTFAALPTGQRLILDIEFGKWDAPTIVDKALAKHDAYGSILVVENNGAQEYLRRFILEKDRSLPVKAFTTGKHVKANPEFGIPAIFVQMKNGAWIFPNKSDANMEKAMKKFIEQCLYYSPDRHTGDLLMAALFANHTAMKLGALRRNNNGSPKVGGLSLLSR